MTHHLAGPPPFRITERDVAIMSANARYRFLTAELVRRIVGGSERGVHNRLRMLSAHRYLVRLSFAVTAPVAYGLANKGARFLAERGCPINHRLDWVGKNDCGRHFLAHTLAVAETMLEFDGATREGTASLIDHHQLLPDMPEPTRHARDPFLLRVVVRHGARNISVPTIPDRLFSLRYHNGTRHNFALELDRGTMDIWASRLVGKSSFRRKLLAYHVAREQQRHTEVWGFKSFRVLTVTTNEERIRNMLDAQRRVAPDCPAGVFLYSTPQRLARHGAFGPAWMTSRSDNVALLHNKIANDNVQSRANVCHRLFHRTVPSLGAARVKRGSSGAASPHA